MASEIGKIFYTGIVLDNKDPMMLGRIRLIPEFEYEDERKLSISEDCAVFDDQRNIIDIKTECAWELSDPFLFTPLLPYHINIVPKIGELVTLIYADVQNALSTFRTLTSNAQFYIQGPYSSPMASPGEQYPNAKALTAQGDLIKKQLKLRNKDSLGTYANTKSKGIFPEPGHNYILGRGSSDVIVKPDEVLLRSGKTKNLNPKNFPEPSDNRSFVQLSTFNVTRDKFTSQLGEILIKFVKKTTNVKKLIEWHIENLENTQNKFTGYVNIYNVKPSGTTTNTDEFDVNTVVAQSLQLPGSVSFSNQTFEEVVSIINSFIRGVNDNHIPFFPKLGPQSTGRPITNQFPFYFRPSARTYSKIKNYATSTSPTKNIEFATLTKFMNSIKLKTTDKQSGYGLVSSRGYLGPFIIPKVEEIFNISTENKSTSYGMMGGQKIYLLSQDSNNPSRGKIDFSNTIYGFTDTDILNKEIPEKTSSVVRGEELIELLELIVRFLLSHVHPHDGLPAVSVGSDGTSSSTILDKLLNAYETILNSNIRIN